MAEQIPLPHPRDKHDEFESSRDLPEKNRRAFAKPEQNSSGPAIQVETKPGLAWTEPPPEAPQRRKRSQKIAPVITEPPIQVETKTKPSEADLGVELIKTIFTDKPSAEVAPPQDLQLTAEEKAAIVAQARAEADESVRAKVAANAAIRKAAFEPSGAAPDAPTVKIPIEAHIDKNIEAARAAAGEPMPAVFRSNRGRPRGGEPEVTLEPAQAEKERREFSLAEVEDIAREQLKGQAEITQLDITETPEGLQLHAELDAGMMGGKIVLNGLIANVGETIAVQGLGIEARGYVKSMIESNLSGFDTAIKSHFEKQYGKPVSSIQVGESGLTVEFEPLPTEPVGEKMASNPGDVPEHIKEGLNNGGTSLEEKSKLKGLVERLVDFAKNEARERVDRSKAYLAERSKSLGEKAKEYGADHEKLIRDIGETYNKLSLWKKIAVGGVLTLGVATVSTVSTPFTMLFGGLIAGQRALGMAGVFVNLEKHLQNTTAGTSQNFLGKREWYKNFIAGRSEQTRQNISATMAMVWSYGMGAAITAGVHEFNQSAWGQQMHNWLKTDAPVKVGHSGEVPAAAAAAGEISPDTTVPDFKLDHPLHPEMPSVEATPGRGYEYMMKRLWEQLQDKGLDPNKYAEGSDVRRLLEADAQSINKVVHDLATDNEFYKSDGTSVQVNLGDKMTVDAKGNIWLGEDILAPEGAPVTAPFHPEAPAPEAPVAPKVEVPVPPAQETPIASHVETPPTPAESLLEHQTVVTPEPIQTIIASDYPREITAVTQETTPAGVVEQSQSIVIPNQFGLGVSLTEPHIYADPGAEHLLVYGGSPMEKMNMITEYLTKNPDKVVFGADNNGEHRILWHMVDGKVETGGPMRTSGLFGFFSDFMEAPEPDEFEKLIK